MRGHEGERGGRGRRPDAALLEGEGHLTLFVNRVAEIQEWLLEGLSP